jgi:hypothetical protein
VAAKTEILAELDALTTHCRPPLMSVEQRTGWMRDWCDDLAKFDIEHVRSAFREWRQSGQTKFPTPGQILPKLRDLANPRRPAEKDLAWRELSDAEYAALDLPAKERHHQIMAHQALAKAGPMWRDGKPLAAEDMPAPWRQWRDRATRHAAEAKRLRELYRRQDLSA